jgi:hypothetical protein
LALVAVLAVLSTYTGAQNPSSVASSTAATPIRAIKHGSLTISVSTVPVAFLLDQGIPEANFVAVPFTTSWDVNSNEVRGIEVVAYFRDSESALASAYGDIRSQQILGRINQGPFRRFTETHAVGTPSASLGLLQMPLDSTNHRGLRNDVLEMRVDRGNSDIVDGTYSGVLQFEARYF